MIRRRARHRCADTLGGPLDDAGARGCPECARRAAAARAATDAMRAELPPAPDDLGDRVLAAVRGEASAASAPEPARRVRIGAPALRRRLARLAPAAAVVLTLGVWGPSVSPLGAPSVAAAVPVAPLPWDCRSDDGRLEVAGVWSGAEAAGFARVLQRFERQTGTPVVYHYETRDIAAKLRARIARGCPPDVALLPQPGLMRDLAREGRIQPLSPATAAVARAGYRRTWRRMARVDGRQYGVWFKASDKSLLWYRPAALRAVGVDVPPRTWGELRRTARRLQGVGIEPLAVAGADGWTLTDWFENVLLREAGVARYDALARHEIPWTDPAVVASLRRLAALIGDPGIVGDRATVLGTTFEGSVHRALGVGATAAMVYEGDFVASFLQRTGRASEPPAFTGFPAIDGRGHGDSVVGGDVAVRFARTRDGRRLMRFLATPQAAEAWAARGNFVSPNRLVAPDAYRDPLSRSVAMRLSRARVVRFDLSDLQPATFGSTAGRGMWRLFGELTRGPGSVAAVARALEREAAAAYGDAGAGAAG